MSLPKTRSENLTNLTPAYDSDYTKDVIAIDVLAEGVLFVVDQEGYTTSYPITAFVAAGGEYTTFPFRLNLAIRSIVGDGAGNVGNGVTGTNIALANLRVLH